MGLDEGPVLVPALCRGVVDVLPSVVFGCRCGSLRGGLCCSGVSKTWITGERAAGECGERGEEVEEKEGGRGEEGERSRVGWGGGGGEGEVGG